MFNKSYSLSLSLSSSMQKLSKICKDYASADKLLLSLLLLVVFFIFFFKKLHIVVGDVCPFFCPFVRPSVLLSSVEIIFGSNLKSNTLIDLKISLNVRKAVVHVRNS